MSFRDCPFRNCPCTHDGGCVKGWIDNDEGTTSPCPVCRWNRVQMPDESRERWMDRLREQDATWQKAS